MRKRYILLKDSPELRKGAILEEKCDAGNQGYVCITGDSHSKYTNRDDVVYGREVVMKSPGWFQEVDFLWLTKEQIKKVKKILKI